jgi:thiol-disulfide isomerase/thioredoxin
MDKQIITSLNKEQFLKEFTTIEDGFIIKFGAEWCGPCKKIEKQVKELMGKTPASVKCAIIDIDDDFELYALFKSKRLINGVPAMFGFKKGNQSGVPDDVVVGADENQIHLFFQKYTPQN